MEDIEVFYMDPAFIDPQVYDLWLRGFSGDFPNLFRLNYVPDSGNHTGDLTVLVERGHKKRKAKQSEKKKIYIYVKIIIVIIIK